jgi:hypothetical protein
VPSQTFQHAATSPLTIDSVWEALERPRTWESVPGVDRVIDPVFDSSGELKGFSFESVVGGKRYVGRASPAGRDHHRLMAWDIDTSEMRGTITVGLSPAEDGTRVYVKLSVEAVGTLASLFFPIISPTIGGGFAVTVEDFVRGMSS